LIVIIILELAFLFQKHTNAREYSHRQTLQDSISKFPIPRLPRQPSSVRSSVSARPTARLTTIPAFKPNIFCCVHTCLAIEDSQISLSLLTRIQSMSKPPPPPAPAATVCPHSIDNNDNNNNDDMPLDTDACVQCGNTSSNTQIRCYECPAYICNNCHWCHDFGHIIRQCDRCQACYCKSCDEMDQCDDCGTIVCASCSTLLSCKFCGGGLCEDCATACGR